MTTEPNDRRVIQCNYRNATKVAVEGARAYLMLNNFRVKTLPPEHPLYGDDHRIWQERTQEQQSLLDEMVDELNAASAREAR